MVGEVELRVVRVTDNFDDSCHLYGTLLGWPVAKEWTEGGRGRIYGYGDVARIELMEAPPTGDPVETVTGVLVSVQHDDVDALHQRLVAAGVEITQPLANQPWGHRNFGILDPSGLKLVFFQER